MFRDSERTLENSAGDASTYKAQYVRPAKLTPPLGTTFSISETYKPHQSVLLAKETAAALAASWNYAFF
jgi:hypothetical protein